jgi:hypothetical protein
MTYKEFDLADGSRVRVFWVNGPPYLNVTVIRPPRELPSYTCGCKAIPSDKIKSMCPAHRAFLQGAFGEGQPL